MIWKDYSTVNEYVRDKDKRISNRRLAEHGKKWNLHHNIRSRTILWGEHSQLSFNIIADVFEAVIGAIAFSLPMNEICFNTIGCIMGNDDRQINSVLKAHSCGYQPYSITKHFNAVQLTESQMVYVEKLEQGQQYPLILQIIHSHQYASKELALLALTNNSAISTFNYNVLFVIR